jgi:hypothetical protein
MLCAGGALVLKNPWLIVFALASMAFIAALVLLVLRISGVTRLSK